MSRRARIIGTGHAVPDRVVTNADLAQRMDTSDEWIVSRTGIRSRRVAEPGEGTSLFAGRAARAALDMAGLAPQDLDYIMCATVTPDMLTPSVACLVQEEIGAHNAAAFDFAAGCTGFIYGLGIATQFIENGAANRILLIGAETLTPFVDWTDRSTSVLFGDGAAAVVLIADDSSRGVCAFKLRSDGTLSKLIEIHAGGSRLPANQYPGPPDPRGYVQMRGSEVFKVAVRSFTEVSDQVMAAAGLQYDEVRWLIPHQANRRIIDAVGQRLAIQPERVYINVDRFGNTSAASVGIALDELNRAGRIDADDVLLMAAFGAGLTWGAAVVRW